MKSLMSKNNDPIINEIIRLMETDKSLDAPPDAIRWSKNIFLNRAVAPKKSILETIRAVLQIDLAPNRAAFGERSASASQARQMFFQAGENALDIRVAETEQKFSVRGQILGEGFANAKIQIGEFITIANKNCEFNFEEIPSGKYNLVVQSGEKEIIVEDLILE